MEYPIFGTASETPQFGSVLQLVFFGLESGAYSGAVSSYVPARTVGFLRMIGRV